MITYFLNWMGPVSVNWYVDRGLYNQVGTRYSPYLKQNIPVYDKSIELACGTIDISGLDPEEYYEGKTEYLCPLMTEDSWNRFSKFLNNLQTENLYSFEELLDKFNETNKEIEWYEENA